MAYTLQDFIADVNRITGQETVPEKITAQVAPLLGRLVRNPAAIPAEYRRRPAGGGRGRYMLHRAPNFNVTAVVWGPGDTAGAHNHETWGVIGVLHNEIEETRFRVTPGAGRAQLEVRGIRRHQPGAVSCLVPPADEVHAMHNPTGRDTVEIHVYGKDWPGSSARRGAPTGRKSRWSARST